MSIASINQGSIGRQPEDSGDVMGRALHEILGIKQGVEPTFYKLLGIEEDETNPTVIMNAADRQMAHVRNFQTSKKYGEAVQVILNRVSNGRITLLDAEKKAQYDETLKMRRTQKETRDNVAAVVPQAVAPVARPAMIAPIVLDRPSRAPSREAEKTLWQKYAIPVGAVAGLTVASIGALWATSSSGKGSDEQSIAAKAELNPGKNAPPAAPAVAPAEPLQPDYILSEEENFPQEEVVEDVQSPAPGPAEETPVVTEQTNAAPVLPPEEVQLAQAPQAVPAAPMVAATKLPERRDLSGLANGKDAGFARVNVPLVDLAEAKQKLVEAFPSADVATVLTLLNSKNVIGSPTRLKAVLEHAMERAKGTAAPEDDAMAFNAVLANAQFYSNAELESHAATALDSKASKGELVSARGLLRKLADRSEIFSKEFVTARTRALLDLAEKKTGDPVLPVLAQDLVQLGAIAPRDAMMIEARDLREQSQNPALRKPTGVEDARQASIRMLNLARDGATLDPVAAQALVDLAKKTVGVKYVRSKEFLDAVALVESTIKTAKQAADYTKILETDPLNVRALQGRADLLLAQGDVEGALDDLEKSGDALATQTRALRANPKGNECYKCGLEWLKLANMTMNGRKASMIVIANELMKSAKSATQDKLDAFAVEAVNMKIAELAKLINEHDVAHVKTAPVPNIVAAPDAAPQWKSVMADIDPKKHAVFGDWSKNERGELTVKSAPNTRLVLPWKFPATRDYDVKMEFDVERTKGINGVQIILPVGKGATVVINGWPERGGVTGITNINGADASKNEATVKGIVLPGGKHVLQVHVKKQGNGIGIAASVDGKQVLSWTGDINALTQSKDLALEAGQTGISTYNSDYTFSDARFMDMGEKQAGPARVQTMKPVIEAGDMEPTKPKGLQEFERKMSVKATWNGETGSWYYLIPNKISFADATKGALAYGATVAIVDSQLENAMLHAMSRGENQWLGYAKNARDGKLYAMDGNPAQYTNMQADEGKDSRETFIQMHGASGQWGDYPEDQALAIFEWKSK
jgi:hypothetical protein